MRHAAGPLSLHLHRGARLRRLRQHVLETGWPAGAKATQGPLGLGELQSLGVGPGPWELSQVGPVSVSALQRLRTGAEMCVHSFPNPPVSARLYASATLCKLILGK